jgi:hypothetical protein
MRQTECGSGFMRQTECGSGSKALLDAITMVPSLPVIHLLITQMHRRDAYLVVTGRHSYTELKEMDDFMYVKAYVCCALKIKYVLQ